MTNQRFHIHAGLFGLFAAAAVGGLAMNASAAGTKSHHAAPKAKAEPARPVGDVVQYEALESRVGQELIIETSFHTTRRGKLIKYTQPALTLQIGTESSPVELTVPRETIKSITVVAPAAEPAKDAGTSGAKKN